MTIPTVSKHWRKTLKEDTKIYSWWKCCETYIVQRLVVLSPDENCHFCVLPWGLCVGYISTTFVEAVEVSKCYSVNSENYCFYTSGSALSWNEARQFCTLRNSTLPIITDEDIDSVFQQFIVNDSYSVIQNTSVWIDAHARPVNNSVSWHWIGGRPSGTDNTVVKKILDVLRRLLSW